MKNKILLLSVIFTLTSCLMLISFGDNITLKTSFVQQEGQWIYYLDDTEMGYLCKIKTDGTGFTKLHKLDANHFVLVDNWIYYTKATAYYQDEGELYRIHMNGTGKEKLFYDKYYEQRVENLAYTNGYITFYAGNRYVMSVEDLKPIETKKFRNHRAQISDGKLVGHSYHALNIYDIATDTTTDLKFTYDLDAYVCSKDWIYFDEYDSTSKRDDIYKMRYDGSEKTLVINDIKQVENLNIFDNQLYYHCVTRNADGTNTYNTFWRTNLDGTEPVLVTTGVIGETTGISNIINDQIYFTDYDYLAFYDIANDKTTYRSLRDGSYTDQSIVLNDAGNVYFTKDNGLVEMTPQMVERPVSEGFTALNEANTPIKDGAVLYNNKNLLALKGRESNIQVMDLTAKTIYTLVDTVDYYISGIDANYVYFKGDVNDNYIRKLYRLPIGELDVTVKEHIWDVLKDRYVDGYMLNQKSQPNYSTNTLHKLNLETLEESKIYSVFIYDAVLENNNLYFVKGNNGGIYRTSITNNKVKKVYSGAQWAANVAVNSTTMFIDTWKFGMYFAKTDLNGKNFEIINTDTVRKFFGCNDTHVVFNALYKYNVYTPTTNTYELMSELKENPIPASVDGSSLFYDVSDKDWFADNLYKLHEQKIISGSKGYFNPNGAFTVDQFLKTLCVALNGEIDGPSTSYWAQKYIDFAIAKGYISDDQFSDYSIEIKRGETAVIIADALELQPLDEATKHVITNKIADFDLIPDVYKTSVLKVYDAGFITGYEDATFKPSNSLIRSEASVVISRIKDSVE